MALRKVAIAGVYATQQARYIDRSKHDLILEALKGALADAGLRATDIDGMAVEWPGEGGAPGEPASWAAQLGTTFTWTGDSRFSSAGPRGLIQAAAAIATGQCNVAVLGGGTSGKAAQRRYATVRNQSPMEFFDTWGGYVAPALALIAQRHMHEYGTSIEQIAEVAATIRNNGHRNPEAVMFDKGPYTVRDILDAPMVASPLTRLMLCLVAQGGAALVLTTMERARDLRKPPISILGAAQEMTGGIYVTAPTLKEDGMLGRQAISRAFGQAGLHPEDIDLYNLYDASAFEIIRQVELLGLCKIGEGGPFVAGGTIAPGGRFPINVDGGCLAYSWNGLQQMTLKIIEGVKQLRGEAGNRQLSKVETSVAAIGAPGSGKYEICILGRA